MSVRSHKGHVCGTQLQVQVTSHPGLLRTVSILTPTNQDF